MRIVNVILVHNINFEESFRNKVVRNANAIEIYLAPIDDIIQMKKLSGRTQDLSDIEMLQKIKQFEKTE